MRTRSIGSLDVSVVGLGCNNFGRRLDEVRSIGVVRAALDAGVTLFDTADVYGATKSEEYVGRALGSRRGEAVLATKFGMAVDEERKGAQPDYVHRALDDSLRRLATDYVDLYQLHAPDPATPVADTLAALDRCVQAGKVREIGCSNFSAEQLRQAEAAVADGAARFVSVQNHYSLLHREPEAEVLPQCRQAGLAFLPYFPLASGVLTGKYRRGQAPPPGTRLATTKPGHGALADATLAYVERLTALAQSWGHTVAELAVAWLAAQTPVVSVIAGATSPEQVHANVAAAAWELDDDQLAAIEALDRPET